MTDDALTVILTHEHTDFDALASMLAAHKLFPAATPVLPRSLNRNLREFLALHRSSLPFRQQEELPRKPVSHAIVVDTQSFTTIRGMKPDTPGLFIDHHAPQRSLPGWDYWGEPVGATTTLLVEKMVERSLDVTPVEATLLLLGIYEDTGSLAYAATTARDLRAAMWLLERGANLEILHRFLHHPLSAAQHELYTRLAESSRVHDIAGHSVLVAAAYAPGYSDEISTLAHALRDMYEPAGLFLLVDLGDRIQVVARSTSDAVDVGEVARELGGGGHARAAAALIRGQTLPALEADLLARLHRLIKPSLTVAQIMTPGQPVTVTPGTTIGDMVEIIQRYGFEGYPVVQSDNGKPGDARGLRGIITRRQVDRAQHHGLATHPIERYMRTGQVTVTPDTSIADLQRVMIEENWGQIPVVDPASQAILGIVTRTDLIKLWGGHPPRSRRHDIAEQLEKSLPSPLLQQLREAGQAAKDLNYPLYAVGGFVRDLLLGRPNFDVDLVVEGDAIKLADRLVKLHGGRIRVHKTFGTAKWILPDAPSGAAHALHGEQQGALPAALDFVSARTEFYTEPTALPVVERSSIKQDLHRRDFTINTLAIDLTTGRWGELLDFYGGERDLNDGVIRVLHTHSFVDDPTRILRAARFEQRFAFRVEARTEQLIRDAVELLDRVTPARVRHELELIFAEKQPELALRRLEEWQVLPMIHPGLHVDEWVVQRFERLRAALARSTAPRPADLDQLYFAIWTYRLTPQDFALLDQRLSLMRSTLTVLQNLHSFRPMLARLEQPDLPPSEIYRLLQDTSAATRFLIPLISDAPMVASYVDRYETSLRHVRTIIDSRELKRMGLTPGPHYGDVVETVRAAWLDGDLHTEADERALVERLISTFLRSS